VGLVFAGFFVVEIVQVVRGGFPPARE
jgi:hypothetical protein